MELCRTRFRNGSAGSQTNCLPFCGSFSIPVQADSFDLGLVVCSTSVQECKRGGGVPLSPLNDSDAVMICFANERNNSCSNRRSGRKSSYGVVFPVNINEFAGRSSPIIQLLLVIDLTDGQTAGLRRYINTPSAQVLTGKVGHPKMRLSTNVCRD